MLFLSSPTVRHLTPFLEINPYKDMLSTISSFYEELDTPEQIPEKDLTIEQALDIVSEPEKRI